MPYSERFKGQLVRKLATPGGPSASVLAKEVGVPQPTLSRWLRQAGTLGDTVTATSSPAGRTMTAKRPQDWTAEEILDVVIEAASVPEAELGAFLRSRGLHEVQLQQWRRQLLASLRPSTGAASRQASAEARRIRELERDLARKDKALAEAAALLVLKKKAQAIWGDEDESIPSKSESRP